jgi:hypothetical protein
LRKGTASAAAASAAILRSREEGRGGCPWIVRENAAARMLVTIQLVTEKQNGHQESQVGGRVKYVWLSLYQRVLGCV